TCSSKQLFPLISLKKNDLQFIAGNIQVSLLFLNQLRFLTTSSDKLLQNRPHTVRLNGRFFALRICSFLACTSRERRRCAEGYLMYEFAKKEPGHEPGSP
ncbi:MAG TPA: hypothetical protein VLN58_02605, partial [Verrucomicrobiae bacterium]|nr:hypothetical protein [Verrucomicrobiae bacterium]